MEPYQKLLLVAGLGAFVQELLHWYSIRRSLKSVDRKLLTNGYYLGIAALMILASAGVTWVWFDGDLPRPTKDYLLLGAAAPALFKKLVSGFGKETAATAGLGTDDAKKSRFERKKATPGDTVSAYFDL